MRMTIASLSDGNARVSVTVQDMQPDGRHVGTLRVTSLGKSTAIALSAVRGPSNGWDAHTGMLQVATEFLRDVRLLHADAQWIIAHYGKSAADAYAELNSLLSDVGPDGSHDGLSAGAWQYACNSRVISHFIDSYADSDD